MSPSADSESLTSMVSEPDLGQDFSLDRSRISLGTASMLGGTVSLLSLEGVSAITWC
eukprot:CAMPEP_0177280292 /NCGR_PEP_ID=MMETSP0367-20130122/70301_1 /TAXON_ID=447022 ORGANISM="Scrippsiella hangoei-like, Strain SHHI-4" /NCGR_SAMPLE_ID=MMETSP0367 /ASSEMBLY_ACC=CAM_ASM_000362 /LENGTH=56 /DNA_ID=CAMNT_0018737041 /DNA_START=18 /DNA_END=188 /DNA_ORIENTATION=+